MKQPALTPEQAEDVRKAVDILRRGGVILYPTDTVWGIGCDARNSEAVRRVFALKKRSDSKALITLVDSMATLERTVEKVPEVAYQLLEAVVTPTTIVYDAAAPGAVAPELPAEDGTIAVRVTEETISQAICRGNRGPIVSTSANISGQPTPRCFAEISEELKQGVDYVCTSGRDEKPAAAAPSSIIRLGSGGQVKIIR